MFNTSRFYSIASDGQFWLTMLWGSHNETRSLGRLIWENHPERATDTELTGYPLLLFLGLLSICPEAGVASLCPAQLPGDLLKALLQSLFTLFMGCLRRNRQEEGYEKQKKRPSSCKLRG